MKRNKTSILRSIITITLIIMILVTTKFLVNLVHHAKAVIHAPTMAEMGPMISSNDNNTLQQLKDSFQFPDSTIQTTKGVITIKRNVEYQEFTYTSKGYSLFLFSIQTIFFIFVFTTLLTVYKLFRSAQKGEIFTTINVKRIRSIAMLLSGYVIFVILEGLCANSILLYLFNSTQNRPAIEMNVDSIFPLLFLLMVILGFMELFKAGIELKEENKLTI